MDTSRPDPEMDAGVSVRGEEVRARVDELFSDADRHGPRAPELSLRIAGAVVILLGATLLTLAGPARSEFGTVAPWLLALVASAVLVTPLARVRVMPLLTAAVVCLAPAAAMVAMGWVVAATPLAAAGALAIGLMCARFIYRAVWALPVLLVAGISDAQSVQGGLTNSLLEDGGTGVARAAGWTIAPDAVRSLDFLVVHLPTTHGMWILGLVDVVAVGLLLGLTHLYWQPLVRTGVALAAALALTLGFGVPVPVLPALGLAWAIANAGLVWRSTRFSLRRLTYLGG